MQFIIFSQSRLHLLHRAGQQADGLFHFGHHGFFRGRRSQRYVLDRSANILLADNDAVFRAALESQLRATNYVIHTATSIAEGLLQLGSDAVVDLVICDAEGDELTGLATLRAYRTDPRLELTPFILLRQPKSCYSVIDCIRAGADDCVSKIHSAIEEIVVRASAMINRSRRHVASMLADFGIAPPKTRLWTLDKTGMTNTQTTLIEKLENALADYSADPGLTMSALARSVGMTVRGLERFCKELVGLTPAVLLRKVRLATCHQLILEGHPVKVAAHRAGFKQHAELARYFKAEFGVNPSDLRRK